LHFSNERDAKCSKCSKREAPRPTSDCDAIDPFDPIWQSDSLESKPQSNRSKCHRE